MDNLISDIYKNSDNLMKDLFSNYNDKKDNLFELSDKNTNVSFKNEISMNINFEKLKIVTMTLNLFLNIDFHFDKLIEKFKEMFYNESIFKIIYLKYLDEDKNLHILGETKKKKTKQFYNSFTCKIEINTNILTVKFFKNGSLHITGCKDINNVKEMLNIMIYFLKNNKELLLDENRIDIGILEKKKILELKNIACDLEIDNYKKLKKTELITEILKTDYLEKICCDKNFIKSTIHKLNPDDIKINTSMINNSYTIYNKVGDEFHNFEIDRRKLYNYMKDNTGLSCYYDNNSHQGVKIYYMFNEHKNGICKCEKNCILKSNKNTTCKKITILIFNSAKIIITGATTDEHSKTAYNHINNLIKENYKDFVQIRIK